MEGVPTKLLAAATLSKDVSEQRTLTGSVGFFRILGLKYIVLKIQNTQN